MLCSVFKTPLKVYDTGSRPMADKTSWLPTENLGNDAVWADFNGDLRPDLFLMRGKFQLSGASLQGNNKMEAYLAGSAVSRQSSSTRRAGSVLTMDIDWKRLGFMWRALHFGVSGDGPNTSERAITLSLDSSDQSLWGIVPNITAEDHGLYIGFDQNANKLDYHVRWRYRVQYGAHPRG